MAEILQIFDASGIGRLFMATAVLLFFAGTLEWCSAFKKFCPVVVAAEWTLKNLFGNWPLLVLVSIGWCIAQFSFIMSEYLNASLVITVSVLLLELLMLELALLMFWHNYKNLNARGKVRQRTYTVHFEAHDMYQLRD